MAIEGEDDIEGGLTDADHLQKLLASLNMTMSKKQLKKYLKRLNIDDFKKTATFKEFYKGILSSPTDYSPLVYIIFAVFYV